MGQAKKRGSYEQRKAEGEARRTAEEQRRREEIAAREAAMTPDQKAQRVRTATMMTAVLGMAAQSMERKLDFAMAMRSLAKPSKTEIRGGL